MSTLSMSSDHLIAIVEGIARNRKTPPTQEELNELMIELLLRNVEKYELGSDPLAIHEYVDSVSADYEYRKPQKPITPVELIKLIQCYQYNSSGGLYWEDSMAKRLTDDLMKLTIKSLPGYEEAPWSI